MLRLLAPYVLAVSPTLRILLWVVGILLASGLFMWVLSFFVASICVYNATLRRQTPDQWSRHPVGLVCNSLRMDDEGQAWHRAHEHQKTDVHIVSDGLNLYGEYYDLGHDRCVIVLSGRTESLRYGYYFAQPYAKAGFNVLVIDPRAHGRSDGEFNTVGFEESRDALAWARYVHEAFGVRSIVLHGICIGAAAGMFAVTSKDCPDYIDAIVTDGMFSNFGESMKNHLIERKKPVLGLYQLIDMWMKHYTGHSMSYGPIDVIGRLNIPILMLYGKEDRYSVPAYAKKLYDLVPGEEKELVWFEHGEHSMLRVTSPDQYDRAIHAFLARYFETAKV